MKKALLILAILLIAVPAHGAGFWGGGGSSSNLAAPGAIGETTPGTIRSLMKEIVKSASGNLTTAEVAGTSICNYGQTNDVTLGLPASDSTIQSFVWRAATTVAKYYRFDPNGSEHIWLDGVDAGAGKYVGLATVAEGDEIIFRRVRNSSGGYDWDAKTQAGTWASEK